MMRPLLNIQLTIEQLRAIRQLIVDQGGDGAMIGIEITNASTGEVSTVDQPFPLDTIDRLIGIAEAAERHLRN